MCINPVFRDIGLRYGVHRIVKTPCNTCMGCRLDNLQLWQNRCNAEFVKSRCAFVTFTYDKYHLKYNNNSLFPSLDKDLIHKFNDNLRHSLKNTSFFNYHYYLCGEYGGMFQRPHYHALFFGLDFKDFQHYFDSKWKQGLIKSLPLLAGGVRYVVDYMASSPLGDKAIQEFDNKFLERPFHFNSKGIGFDWFMAHFDEIADTGTVQCGLRSVPVPSYYVNMFRNFDFDCLQNFYKQKVLSFRARDKKVKANGFNDYQQWLDYTCRAKYKVLKQQFLSSDNLPILESFYENESQIFNYSDTQIYNLALQALEI